MTKRTEGMRGILAIIVLGAALCGAILCESGCASLQPGADPLVVRAEQSMQVAKGTADMVLNIDNADRGFWRTNAPAFHNFCEWMRQPQVVELTNVLPRVSAMIWQVNTIKDAYKSSTSHSNALYSAVVVLEAVASEGSSWLTLTTNSAHLGPR